MDKVHPEVLKVLDVVGLDLSPVSHGWMRTTPVERWTRMEVSFLKGDHRVCSSCQRTTVLTPRTVYCRASEGRSNC